MKCKLYLFIDSLLPKENQNYVYEDMTLASLTSIAEFGAYDTIDNFQVLRPTLDLSIKINKTQLTAFRKNGDSNYSYCLIQWWDENTDYVMSQRWYFVRDILQVAYDTIQLNLHMDVLNSFKLDNNGDFTINPYYMITSKSIIKRLHKDRLTNLQHRQIPLPVGYTFTPICDFNPEGINPILFKKSQLYIEDDNQSWYMVYVNTNAPAQSGDKEADYVNPVKALIFSDRGYSIDVTTHTAISVDLYATSSLIPKVNNKEEVLIVSYPQCEASHSIRTDTTTYSLYPKTDSTSGHYHQMVFRRKNNNDTKFRVYGVKIVSGASIDTYLGESEKVTFFGIQQCNIVYTALWVYGGAWTYLYDKPESASSFEINSGTIITPISHTGGAIDSLDRTDSKIIKITAFPYCPFDFFPVNDSVTYLPDGITWDNVYNAFSIDPLKLNNTSRLLDLPYPIEREGFVLHSNNPFLISTMDREISFETKLLHSEFHYKKLIYESYFKIFRQELYDISSDYTGYMSYSISPNISSSFLLVFNDYITNISDESYDNVLLVDKVNELPLYNNSYINYLRTGFQYDLDSNQRQDTQRILGIAFTTIGSVASFVSTGVTHGFGIASGISLATSSATQIAGAISSAKQNDENIKARIVQAQQQATSVSGSSDFSLMKQYTTNQCKLETWEVSEEMKQALYNLFYFCGYATYQYAPNTPEDLYTLLHTRQLFNFIQADIELQNPSMFDKDIANEIIQKWGEGITFIHKNNFGNNEVKDKWVTPTELKENIETSQLS